MYSIRLFMKRYLARCTGRNEGGTQCCHLSGAILDSTMSGQLAVTHLSDASIEVVVAKSSFVGGVDTVLCVNLVPINGTNRASATGQTVGEEGTEDPAGECRFLVRLAAQISQYCIRGSWERIQSETEKRAIMSRVHPLSVSVLAMEHFVRRRELDRISGDNGL